MRSVDSEEQVPNARVDGAGDTGTSATGSVRRSAVVRCVEGLRKMILSRSLLPGEQIRQADMAERLEVSRVPLREALKVLQTEGVLLHSPNQGYFVAKLGSAELSQLYLMRQLLEAELLKSIEWPDGSFLERSAATNHAMQEAIEQENFEDLVATNRIFHFQVFDLSPLNLVRKEVERLWALSDSYRAIHLYDSNSRARIVDEHEMIIDALAKRDRDALISVSDLHRSGLQRHITALFGPD